MFRFLRQISVAGILSLLLQSALDVRVADADLPNPYRPPQCTYYAAQRRPDLRVFHGHAKDWDELARAHGFPVVSYPVVGAIVVFEPGVQDADPTNGHVGYVERVIDSTRFQLSEMNFGDNPWEEHHRTAHIGSGVSFILEIATKKETPAPNPKPSEPAPVPVPQTEDTETPAGPSIQEMVGSVVEKLQELVADSTKKITGFLVGKFQELAEASTQKIRELLTPTKLAVPPTPTPILGVEKLRALADVSVREVPGGVDLPDPFDRVCDFYSFYSFYDPSLMDQAAYDKAMKDYKACLTNAPALTKTVLLSDRSGNPNGLVLYSVQVSGTVDITTVEGGDYGILVYIDSNDSNYFFYWIYISKELRSSREVFIPPEGTVVKPGDAVLMIVGDSYRQVSACRGNPWEDRTWWIGWEEDAMLCGWYQRS